MPFYLHTGRAGSGKSYNVIEKVILKSLEQGRTVLTNIPVIAEEFEKDPERFTGSLYQFDIENLDDDFFINVHKGAIYVFDEAQKLWPSGLTVTDFPQDQKRFLSEHRHYVDDQGNSCQIVLISQDASFIAKYPRTLADNTFIYRKLSAVGSSKSFNVHIFEGCVFLEDANRETPINTYLAKYNPKIFKFYKSHTLSDSTILGADENAVDNRTSVFSSWKFKYGFPLVLIAFVFLIFQVISLFDPEESQLTSAGSLSRDSSAFPISNQTSEDENRNPSKNLESMTLEDFDEIYISKKYRIAFYDLTGKVRITDGLDFFYLNFKDNCKFHPLYGVVCLFQNEFLILKNGIYDDEESNILN